jgi:histidinol-phosphate phosphatase family protein
METIKKISNLKDLNIDKSWTLFLDRDGVINKRLMADYVKNLGEFEFLEGAIDAISKFSEIFGRIFVVTNQRGVFAKIMTADDVDFIHNHMVSEINKAGGKIDGIYYCPHDRNEGCSCRKPSPGMAFQAQKDFPEVDLDKAIMVGDTTPDMVFGKNAGMYTIMITSEPTEEFSAPSLIELSKLF